MYLTSFRFSHAFNSLGHGPIFSNSIAISHVILFSPQYRQLFPFPHSPEPAKRLPRRIHSSFRVFGEECSIAKTRWQIICNYVPPWD